MTSHVADGVEDKNSWHLLSHTPAHRSGRWWKTLCTDFGALYDPSGEVRCFSYQLFSRQSNGCQLPEGVHALAVRLSNMRPRWGHALQVTLFFFLFFSAGGISFKRRRLRKIMLVASRLWDCEGSSVAGWVISLSLVCSWKDMSLKPHPATTNCWELVSSWQGGAFRKMVTKCRSGKHTVLSVD